MAVAKFTNLLRVADFTSVCSLEHENLKELDLGYVLVIHKLKNISRDVNPVYEELRQPISLLWSFLIVQIALVLHKSTCLTKPIRIYMGVLILGVIHQYI